MDNPASFAIARQGEVWALEWNDVDRKSGVIRIRQTLKENGGHLAIGPTKGKTETLLDDLVNHTHRVANPQEALSKNASAATALESLVPSGGTAVAKNF